MTAPAIYNDAHLDSTPLDRQEALELLAALQAGVDIMQPELRHLQALLELQAEGPQRRAM